MNKILVSTILCLLLIPCLTDAESNLFSGFIPAIPDSVTTFFAETDAPYIADFTQSLVLLEIDKKGKLKKVNVENKADSMLLPYLTPYFKSLSYKPATLKNKKIKSILPVNVDIKRKKSAPEFIFPVLNQFQVDNSQIYFTALTYNSIEFPEILSFPPYYCDIKVTDSSLSYPYVLLKVSLGKMGEITKIEPLVSTSPSFQDQLISAVLYSQITPMKIKGKETETDIHLLVSLFPQVSYPTNTYLSSEKDSLELLELYRVRILPQANNYLMPALPKSYKSEEFNLTHLKSRYSGNPRAFVHIDTTGAINLLHAAGNNKHMIANFRVLFKKMKFYPAVGIDGEKKDFYGYIQISPKDRLTVRISYLWLE